MYRDVLALMVSKSLVDWNLLGECPSHCWRTQRDLAKSMDNASSLQRHTLGDADLSGSRISHTGNRLKPLQTRRAFHERETFSLQFAVTHRQLSQRDRPPGHLPYLALRQTEREYISGRRRICRAVNQHGFI